MRSINFAEKAFKDYFTLSLRDKKIFGKIKDLILESSRTPFEGAGKPEPLNHNLKGYWSRRITDEHRLIYKVTNETIHVVNCMGHYQ